MQRNANFSKPRRTTMNTTIELNIAAIRLNTRKINVNVPGTFPKK